MSGITRPDGSYNAVAKIFHWLTAPLLLAAIATGFTIAHTRDASKMGFYAIHESLGFTILMLAVARLLWRRFNPPPPLPDHFPRPLRQVAAGAHHALYAALILQPLLGFFATNAFGFPMRGQTAYLGFIDFPKFMEGNETLAWILLGAHQWLAWLLVPLLLAHIGGAIWHHSIRRDGTLMRMI